MNAIERRIRSAALYQYGPGYMNGPGRVYLVRPKSERDQPNHPGYRGKIKVRDGCVWMDPDEVEVLIGEEWMHADTDADLITVPLSQVEMIEWGERWTPEREAEKVPPPPPPAMKTEIRPIP